MVPTIKCTWELILRVLRLYLGFGLSSSRFAFVYSPSGNLPTFLQ